MGMSAFTCVHLSVTKLNHVSLSKMIMVHNCCCAVIDVQSLHKDRGRWHLQANVSLMNKKRKTAKDAGTVTSRSIMQ